MDKIFKMFLFEVDEKTLENFSDKYENVRNKFENKLENEEKMRFKDFIKTKRVDVNFEII
jgi:hypothetical protein